MARVQTNYYHSYSKGLDTSSGMRNVAPSTNSLQQAYQDSLDAQKYRELISKAQVVDGNRYNPSLIPENADYTDKKWKESATFQDQRVINNAAEAETRRRRMNDVSNSNEWYAKQWDDSINYNRKLQSSGSSLGSGDEIDMYNANEALRMRFGGNAQPGSNPSEARRRRLYEQNYSINAQMKNNEAARSHEMQLARYNAEQGRQNSLLEFQNSAADRASKERIASTQATASIASSIYSRPYDWQYWG